MSFRKLTAIAAVVAFLLTGNLFAGLRDTTNQADYIFISSHEYTQGLEELFVHRMDDGFSIRLGTLEKIHAEFPNENLSESIREFISYALTYWKKPAPRYVLLAGGVNIIPVIKEKAYLQDSVSIDEYYAINKNQNDILPDVALGRLPFRNAAELKNMSDKIIAFDNLETTSVYTNDFLFFADSTDEIFEDICNSIINSLIPPYLRADRIYFRHGTEYSGNKQDFLNSLNKGTFYLVGMMHANPFLWGHADILDTFDIAANAFTCQPAIFTAMGCNQAFDNPNKQSLVESLLAMKGSGLAAGFVSSGITWSSIGNNMVTKFLDYSVNSPDIRIGDITFKAKQKLYEVMDKEYIRQYTLLGDPAMKIPKWLKASTPELPAESMAMIITPNPSSEYVKIDLSILNDDFVNLEIFDMLGSRVAMLCHSRLQTGNYSYIWDCGEYPQGAYVCRMSLGNGHVSKMVILQK